MIGYYRSPFGYIRYVYQNEMLSSLSFVDQKPKQYSFDETINQALEKYFKGKLKVFKFSYDLSGYTDFQKDVFRALLKIPFGQTKSYAEIANEIGKPNAYRAVGQACKRNPVGIMIPCHRVIGSDRSLTGYSGKDYIYLKKQLLDLEQKY